MPFCLVGDKDVDEEVDHHEQHDGDKCEEGVVYAFWEDVPESGCKEEDCDADQDLGCDLDQGAVDSFSCEGVGDDCQAGDG
ncbi:hypothetical protein AM500_04155 [Bacillus sp. FJAT-18017]|nr:hypothetical protein AM500_04155 [Bacillus sp. FJAT-18017]